MATTLAEQVMATITAAPEGFKLVFSKVSKEGLNGLLGECAFPHATIFFFHT